VEEKRTLLLECVCPRVPVLGRYIDTRAFFSPSISAGRYISEGRGHTVMVFKISGFARRLWVMRDGPGHIPGATWLFEVATNSFISRGRLPVEKQ